MKLYSLIIVILVLIFFINFTKCDDISIEKFRKLRFSDAFYYHSHCYTDEGCGVLTNMECINSTCECVKDARWNNDIDKCVRKCIPNSVNECSDEDKNSNCINDICVCNENYKYSKVFKKCISNNGCQANLDCPMNAECVYGECMCKCGYTMEDNSCKDNRTPSLMVDSTNNFAIGIYALMILAALVGINLLILKLYFAKRRNKTLSINQESDIKPPPYSECYKY